MIEWDDFDWRKVVGIILLALLVIAGAIFVIDDNVTSNRTKNSLETQLKVLNGFQNTYQPPSRKELDQMSAQVDSLKADFSKMPLKLGDSVDTAALETKIKNLASANSVSLDKLDLGAETKDKFYKVYPVALSISGQMEQLSKFVAALSDIGIPWRRHGEPENTTSGISMSLEFLAFDQDGWDQSYSCNLSVKVPQNLQVNIDRVRIFKDDLIGLQGQVENMQGKLADAKKTLGEQCNFQRQIDGLQTKIQMTKDFSQ
jgi:Tfp pilus assembly protein PilO